MQKADMPGKNIQIGNLKVNFDTYNAFVKDKDVKLSIKEYEILHLLWN